MLQVFQVVTMEGWTALMVPLLQSVGSWIFIYFYPIIFIGAFFLLNLTLAVIKAKFTEEMNNKKEAAAPKKKKLDDAPSSSEDEELQAEMLKEKLEQIRESKNMSPRTKENTIKKIKVEHMIWKIDQAFEQKDIEYKIVEKGALEQEASMANRDKFVRKSRKERVTNEQIMKGNKVLDAVARISILKPAVSAFSVAKSSISAGTSKAKVHPKNVNYSQVFQNGGASQTMSGLLDFPRGAGTMKQVASSLSKKQFRINVPIKEDEEE